MSLTRRAFAQAGLGAAAYAALRPRGSALAAGAPPVPFEMALPVAPVFADRVFDIRAFGAAAGGVSSCTQAIAGAIVACAKAGGGRVLVPDGVWQTGPVHLKSGVELHLADGAELRFSQRFADYLPPVFMQRGGVRCYGYSPLVYANACSSIAVTGRGTLNGRGEAWWPWKERQPGMSRLFKAGAEGVPVEKRVFASEEEGVRPPFVHFIGCKDVLLDGVTVLDGPSWNIHPVCCENVTVRNVSVAALGPNNDGIDPDSCRNVLIEGCTLDVGDDCICLKAGRDQDGWAVAKPCENVVIRHCQTKRGHGGVVLGSEMSAGIRNVFVHDCRFEGTARGIRIKSQPGRGGFMENFWFQDLAMDKIGAAAVNVTFRYSKPDSEGKAQPRLRNVQIRRVTCGQAKRAVEFQGLEENAMRDLLLEDARIAAKQGLVAECVEGLTLTRVALTAESGPLMRLRDVRGATISACACPAGTEVFLRVEGSSTRDVRVAGMDLSNAKRPVEFGEGVPADAVKR